MGGCGLQVKTNNLFRSPQVTSAAFIVLDVPQNSMALGTLLGLFNLVGKDTINSWKLELHKLKLETGHSFLTVFNHRNNQPREVVYSPLLEVFRS